MDRGEFGYLCAYFPVEVVMAAGYRPVRLLPSAPATPAGILPSFLCAPVRAYLASALAGAYRHLAGVGITHACDAMQCLAQSWQVLVREPPLYLVRFPTRRHQIALSHLVRELRDLGARLPVPVEETALIQAITAARARRHKLREVIRRRAHLPPHVVWHALSQPWADAGAGGAEEAPAGADAAGARAVPAADAAGAQAVPAGEDAVGAQAAQAGAGLTGARVVLSGSILSSPRLLETVREAGGIVVGDDLCSGERGLGVARVTWSPPPAGGATGTGEGESDPAGTAPGDPWQALARQYLEMTPCPCRHPSLGERVQHLIELVADRSARGVILLREKFCEPHRWEDRALAAELRRRGIAVLELETEAGDVSGERDLTRLEAFLETVTASGSSEG